MGATATIQPTAEDMRTIAAYEALMWAMAEPGTIHTLPAAGEGAIAETLIDRECTAFASTADMEALLPTLGARIVALPDADYVFARLDAPDAVQIVMTAAIGTFDYPESGATLIAPARFHDPDAQRLTLRGPGIDDGRRIALSGVTAEVWEARARAIRYPLGFDMILVDEDRIVALPRSTSVEVL